MRGASWGSIWAMAEWGGAKRRASLARDCSASGHQIETVNIYMGRHVHARMHAHSKVLGQKNDIRKSCRGKVYVHVLACSNAFQYIQ